eukprot:Colp12_sorted_trinity150504_noHs@15625
MSFIIDEYRETFSRIWETGTWKIAAIREEKGLGLQLLIDFFKDLADFMTVSWEDVAWIVSIAVGLTFLRLFVTNSILDPLCRYVNLRPKGLKKFPESAWKAIYYTITWVWCAYILTLPEHPYFHDPRSVWFTYAKGEFVPPVVYFLYMLQLGFYVHSIYATLYMDEKRKDLVVMMVHHFVTIFLIFFSYSVRYYRIGILVLLMHDFNDICLETAKCFGYLRDRGGPMKKFWDTLTTITFLVFASSWVLFRLWWFPHKVLKSTGHYSMVYVKHLPFYMFFNAMLWILQLMHLYWWVLILLLIIRVVTKGDVDDNREDHEDDDATAKEAVAANRPKPSKVKKID